jgi:hypothetical protein
MAASHQVALGLFLRFVKNLDKCVKYNNFESPNPKINSMTSQLKKRPAQFYYFPNVLSD